MPLAATRAPYTLFIVDDDTFFHWSCCHPAYMSEKRRSVKTGQLPARP